MENVNTEKRKRKYILYIILILCAVIAVGVFLKSKNNSEQSVVTIEHFTNEQNIEIDGIEWGVDVSKVKSLFGKEDDSLEQGGTNIKRYFPKRQIKFKEIDAETEVIRFHFNSDEQLYSVSYFLKADTKEEINEVFQKFKEYFLTNMPEEFVFEEQNLGTETLRWTDKEGNTLALANRSDTLVDFAITVRSGTFKAD